MSTPTSPSRNGAFTLLEILVVLSIIVLVAGLTTPAVTTILRGSSLTQGGQLVTDQLGLARQTALSRNRSVEVRFYQYGDPETPGEQENNPSSGKFRALQLFEIQESGTDAKPLGKVRTIPPSVIMDGGTALSSILGAAQSSSSPSAATGSDLNSPIPRVDKQYNAVTFRFLPDGSTNLSPQTGSWFLTLHALKEGDRLSAPKADFFTIQIDAINGHFKTFRP